jgi:teichuronic acid biosynthesis glycosyltransferase TuaG
MNRVDIIMPNYNKADYLEEAIKSVIEQSYHEWKLYIIDDQSNDSSSKILEKYKKKNNIEIIILNKNKGPSFCRNFGMRISNNEYIAFIDSDDYWTVNKLKNQITYMKAKKIDMTFTDYIPFIQKKDKKLFLKKTNITKKIDLKKFYRNTSINTSTLVFKRSILGSTRFKKLEKLEDYIFKCDFLKKTDAFKFEETSAYYRILSQGRSGNKFKNLWYLWKLNKNYNKLNLIDNLISILLVSYNSFKKYGFK